jgi:hypothetical protein
VGALALLGRQLARFTAWWRRSDRATLPNVAEPAVVTHEEFVSAYQPTNERLRLVAGRQFPAGKWMPALGAAIRRLAEMADFLLGMDVTRVELVPDNAATRAQCSTEIRARTDALRTVVGYRPTVLRVAPKLRGFWPDRLHRQILDVIARSDAALKRMSGPIGLKPTMERAHDAISAVDRYVPFLFDGTQEETPAEIMEFCAQEKIAGYLNVAVNTAHRAFPDAKNLRLLLESDPESDEQWVSIGFDVPDDNTLFRFLAYQELLAEAMPLDTTNKFRLFYNVL